MKLSKKQRQKVGLSMTFLATVSGTIITSIYLFKNTTKILTTILSNNAAMLRAEKIDWDSLPLGEYFLFSSILFLLPRISWAVYLKINEKEEEEIEFRGTSESSRTQAIFRRDGWTSELVGYSSQESGENKVLFNQIPSGCRGCQNLHGQVYGNNLLVCGLHPYGQENCPDYE